MSDTESYIDNEAQLAAALRRLVSLIMEDKAGADLLPVDPEHDPGHYEAICDARAALYAYDENAYRETVTYSVERDEVHENWQVCYTEEGGPPIAFAWCDDLGAANLIKDLMHDWWQEYGHPDVHPTGN